MITQYEYNTPLTAIFPHQAPERPQEVPDGLGQGEQAQRLKSLHQRAMVGQTTAWDRFTATPMEDF